MSIFTKVQGAGFATLLLSLSIFLSRFMGLIRDKLISWNFGATVETDIYFIAFIIPDFINYLLAGGYFSIILVPLLTKYFSQGEEEGYRFVSNILSTVCSAIVLLTIILWLLAPYIAPYIAANLREEELQRLVLFIRIILPAQVFFLVGAVFSAVLYMRKQFVVPALMPLLYNGMIILCGIVFSAQGMIGYCYGVTIGAFLGAFLLPLYAVQQGGFSFSLGMRHKGVIAFIMLALPLMLGQSITVLEEQFLRIFGSYLSDGSVSVLSYARRIMLLPIGVVAQAIGIASYPFLSSLLTQGDIDGFSVTLRTALRNTLYILLPLTVFMFLVAEQIIALLFYGGEFKKDIVIATTPLLQILLLGVPAWGIQQVIVRGFYANKDTLWPTIIGTLVTLLSLPLYYYGAIYLDTIGIALASTVAISFYMIVLSIYWSIQYFRAVFKGICSLVLITSLELIPAICILYYLSPYCFDIMTQLSYGYFWDSFFLLSLYSIIFWTTYIVTLVVVQSERYTFFLGFIKRRKEKKR